jgi:hypothetical protein
MTKPENGHSRKLDRGRDARAEDDDALYPLARRGLGGERFRIFIFVLGAALVGVAAALAFLIFWR